MVLEYYKNNPSASQSLKGSLYEEKDYRIDQVLKLISSQKREIQKRLKK